MFSSFEGPDRRREETRIRSEGRLPPGQSLTLKFPVLHYGPVPHFNPATWHLRQNTISSDWRSRLPSNN